MSLFIKKTEKYGRGIFTTSDIKKDEIVEISPVIVIPIDQWKYIKKTILYNYCFIWDNADEDLAIALGFGSLFNHSYNPSIGYYCDTENLAINFYALRDILEDEELTINYHGDPDNKSPLWFDVIE